MLIMEAEEGDQHLEDHYSNPNIQRMGMNRTNKILKYIGQNEEKRNDCLAMSGKGNTNDSVTPSLRNQN